MITKSNTFATTEPPITGTPEQVTKQLTEFVNLGVEYFILRFLDFPNYSGLELFTESLTPANNVRPR